MNESIYLFIYLFSLKNINIIQFYIYFGNFVVDFILSNYFIIYFVHNTPRRRSLFANVYYY